MSQGETFQALLEARLTPEQRAVVEQLGHGPVKVLAAAGSGKTTTMAWLYAAGLVRGLGLDQIMAVTFTRRAASELRQRVQQVLVEAGLEPSSDPSEPLQGAWMGTFHHLVRRLLQERSYLARVPPDLEELDEVGAGILMDETLEWLRAQAAAADSWLRLLPEDADPRSLLSLLGEAARAVRALRSTPLRPEACERSSEDAYRAMEREGQREEEIRWHRAALALTLRIWREYERRLERRGAVDFDGLLRLGLSALGGSEQLLAWCRRQFQLVIVDEYQDTSAVQESLIQLLTGPEQRSLFMVGDARQSIYGFRDAKPAVLADAPGREFRLFSNHRSRRSILGAADLVIQQDPTFAQDQAMTPVRGALGYRPVLIAEFEKLEAEAEAVAGLLAELHRTGIIYPDGTAEPVAWRDLAVLARTQRRLGPLLEECLRRRGVPFQVVTAGLLQRPEVKDLRAFLRLAADDGDDLACLRTLQSPLVRLPDRALVALHKGKGRPATLMARLEEQLGRGAPGWAPAWRQRASWLLAVVRRLRELARTGRGAEVLSVALEETGLLRLHEARARGQVEGGRRGLSSLRQLERLAWAQDPSRSWLDLPGLLARLDLLDEEGVTVEPPPGPDEDEVTLSTVHKAKGLEWKVVVLVDCRPFSERGQGAVLWDAELGAVLYTHLEGEQTAAYQRWRASPASGREREELRRVVYVAMTRARDLLVVTTCRTGKAGEFLELRRAAEEGVPWVATWDPAAPLGASLPAGAGESPGDSVPPAGSIERRPAPAPALLRRFQLAAGGGAAPVARFTALDHLSFTSIEELLSCPRQFWYHHLAGFPDQGGAAPGPGGPGRERALGLGLTVHSALERLHRESPSRAPRLEAARELLAPLPQELGQEALRLVEAYLEGPLAALPTVAVEFGFTWTDWADPGTPPLVGLIDRVARRPSGGLVLVDYKTNLTIGPAQLAEYSRQLQLYAAAIAAGALGAPVAAPECALAALRSGEVLEIPSGPEDRERALEWARQAAGLVALGDYRADTRFPERPCERCPYAELCPERRSGAASALVGELEEVR